MESVMHTVQLTANIASTSLDPHLPHVQPTLDPHASHKSSNASQVLAFITPEYHFIKVALKIMHCTCLPYLCATKKNYSQVNQSRVRKQRESVKFVMTCMVKNQVCICD